VFFCGLFETRYACAAFDTSPQVTRLLDHIDGGILKSSALFVNIQVSSG
jgi:hypothetical protein